MYAQSCDWFLSQGHGYFKFALTTVFTKFVHIMIDESKVSFDFDNFHMPLQSYVYYFADCAYKKLKFNMIHVIQLWYDQIILNFCAVLRLMKVSSFRYN
jgi:hypothetical protein